MQQGNYAGKLIGRRIAGKTDLPPFRYFDKGNMAVVAGRMKIALPPDTAVDAEVDLGPSGEAYGVAARLNVSLPGLDRDTAERLIAATHAVCPYSRATHGNIDVTTTLV